MTHPPALTAPAHPITLEQRRDLWHADQRVLDDKGRGQCLTLYRAYPPYLNLYPQSSLRDFLTWWGYGEFNGKFYTWFHAGLALDQGFTAPHLTRGDLALIGQALLEGAVLLDRYRTHNRLVPLCARHHGARAGDAEDSIHARKFADVREDADFWRRAFIAVSDAAEQTRPQEGHHDD